MTQPDYSAYWAAATAATVGWPQAQQAYNLQCRPHQHQHPRLCRHILLLNSQLYMRTMAMEAHRIFNYSSNNNVHVTWMLYETHISFSSNWQVPRLTTIWQIMTTTHLKQPTQHTVAWRGTSPGMITAHKTKHETAQRRLQCHISPLYHMSYCSLDSCFKPPLNISRLSKKT